MLSNSSLTPVGLALTLAVSALPSVGFYPVEFVENGQVAVPNLVTINGTGNTGTADLVVNDAVLHTTDDRMVFAVDNTGGGDMMINLYIAKTPVDNFTVAVKTLQSYFAGGFSVAVKAGEQLTFTLTKTNGEYVVDKTVAAGTTPVANQLVFSDLQNCTYANDMLTYTSGDLAIWGGTGYQAMSDKPCNIQITWGNTGLLYYCGNNSDINSSLADNAEGIIMEFLSTEMLGGLVDDNPTLGVTKIKMNTGDLLQITIKNNAVTFENTTTGQTWTSPQSDYLENPKYLGVIVNGTDPLTIKAL